MRYFFTRRVPDARDVLLIESGAPEVAQRAIENMTRLFPAARFHLCTCQSGADPEVFSSVFRAADYPTTWSKVRLLMSFFRRRWPVLAILCTGEPILWRWKLLAVLLLPAKVLVVNENADFFWLDWQNWRTLRRLAGIRWGVNFEESFYTLLRILIFPFTFLFLLLTAGLLFGRRLRRLLLRKVRSAEQIEPAPAETARVCQTAPQRRE